ncbi:MAG: hypothetical protein ACREWG_14680, partial [Gammaproteobacteria bacterium]
DTALAPHVGVIAKCSIESMILGTVSIAAAGFSAYAILLAHAQGNDRSSGEIETICRPRTSGGLNDGELLRGDDTMLG